MHDVKSYFNQATAFNDIHLNNYYFGTTGFKIVGAAYDDQLGSAVPAGDFNGDGLEDFVIAAVFADPESRYNAGEAYVYFGQVGGLSGTIDLAYVTFNPSLGFKILGAAMDDYLYMYGISAGDIDGDGYSDIVISLEAVDYGSLISCGGVYVLFGHNSSSYAFEDIDLRTFTSGSRGFRVFGIAAYSRCSQGQHVGDVNGDGYGDISIACNNYDSATVTSIIYGHNHTTSFVDIDLTSFPSGNGTGFLIHGPSFANVNQLPTSRAGDFNHDGYDDLVVTNRYFDFGTGSSMGGAYVIFGHANMSDINLETFESGADGLRIFDASKQYPGGDASFAGDVNGDGIDDLALVWGTGLDGVDYILVLFGTNANTTYTEMDMSTDVLGDQGFWILGDNLNNDMPTVQRAGDVNGDGYGDLMCSSSYPHGVTYVIFGNGLMDDVDLAAFTTSASTGFRIYAYGDYDHLQPMPNIGDFNGDGISDIMVSAEYAAYVTGSIDRQYCGVAYVLYGVPFDAPTASPTIGPSSGPDNSWWIITVSVVGGVIVLSGMAALVLMCFFYRSQASTTAPTYAPVPPPNSVHVADVSGNTLQAPYRAPTWDQGKTSSAPSVPYLGQNTGISTNTVPNYYPGGSVAMVPVHAPQAADHSAMEHSAYKSAASAPTASTSTPPIVLTMTTAVPYSGSTGNYEVVEAHVVAGSADV